MDASARCIFQLLLQGFIQFKDAIVKSIFMVILMVLMKKKRMEHL